MNISVETIHSLEMEKPILLLNNVTDNTRLNEIPTVVNVENLHTCLRRRIIENIIT